MEALGFLRRGPRQYRALPVPLIADGPNVDLAAVAQGDTRSSISRRRCRLICSCQTTFSSRRSLRSRILSIIRRNCSWTIAVRSAADFLSGVMVRRRGPKYSGLSSKASSSALRCSIRACAL